MRKIPHRNYKENPLSAEEIARIAYNSMLLEGRSADYEHILKCVKELMEKQGEVSESGKEQSWKDCEGN